MAITLIDGFSLGEEVVGGGGGGNLEPGTFICRSNCELANFNLIRSLIGNVSCLMCVSYRLLVIIILVKQTGVCVCVKGAGTDN